MDDAWGDLFAKAEGATTTELVTTNDDDDHPHDDRHKKSSRKRKRHHKKKPVVEESFRSMLEARMMVPQEDTLWPSWFHLGGSLGKLCSSLCLEFDNGPDGAGSGEKCRKCQQSAFYHKLSVSKSNSNSNNNNEGHSSAHIWPLHLFCHLRNIRCAAKIWIWNPTTKTKYMLRALKEQLKACSYHMRMIPRTLAPSEASILESKTQHFTATVQPILDENQYSFETLVRVIMACDDVYYRLYYLQITRQLPPMKLHEEAVYLPHPQEYFGLPGVTGDPQLEKKGCRAFLANLKDDKDVLQRVGMDMDIETDDTAKFHSEADYSDSHRLLALRRYRFVETVSMFYQTKWYQSEETQQQTVKSLEEQDNRDSNDEEEEETPAPQILAEWRDSCRDFLCHLYAYATLSTKSLEGIQQFLSQNDISGGIWEYGAGTGYLAKVLADRGVAIRAYDVCPTLESAALSVTHKSSSLAHPNDFHGLTPSFLPVHHGSVGTLGTDMKRSSSGKEDVALLLCYPPPRSDMAYSMLKTFADHGGKAFIHIGEFRGLTGNSAFEKLLLKQFECHGRYPCLSWGTDASEVTLWVRASSKKQPDPRCLLPCCFCGKKEATRRCRLLRYLVYCSEDCYLNDSISGSKHLLMNMIQLGPNVKLNYSDQRHFAVLGGKK